jgi:hypothetical protein
MREIHFVAQCRKWKGIFPWSEKCSFDKGHTGEHSFIVAVKAQRAIAEKRNNTLSILESAGLNVWKSPNTGQYSCRYCKEKMKDVEQAITTQVLSPGGEVFADTKNVRLGIVCLRCGYCFSAINIIDEINITQFITNNLKQNVPLPKQKLTDLLGQLETQCDVVRGLIGAPPQLGPYRS